MMNIKGIFAVSLIAMVAVVAGTHTSNAVAAIASQGYVDEQVGLVEEKIPDAITVDSALSSTSTNPVQNKVINTALNSKEVTSNKVTSANYDANVSSDTKYPTVKAVANAIADVEKTIPDAITVDSALSSTSTNPVQNKVINTALAGKQATLSAVQLNAVNSGITKDKVTTYDGYNEKITAAQNAADDAAAAANGKVTIAQGSGAVNKAVITNSSGNVTTGTISSGMIADGTITNADISASAAIAQSKISGLTTALAGKVATAQGSNAVNKAVITDASGNITTGQIASGMIAKDAVTADKIADGVIPTVNNATLTIQKNGSTVDTFTANASANKTINITVPTKTSQLTNDSDFITAEQLPDEYTLPVATADTLGGVKSGGDITVSSTGAVTVNSATRADSATNAKTAATDVEGNNIILTYATKSEITGLNSTSTGTGAVVTDVSQSAGEVSVTRGNVKIPVGGENATDYAAIWVQ